MASPNRRECLIASSQDLVDIGLMTCIPDQLVPWGIVSVVQRHSELGHSKARAEVPPLFSDHINMTITDGLHDFVEPLLTE